MLSLLKIVDILLDLKTNLSKSTIMAIDIQQDRLQRLAGVVGWPIEKFRILGPNGRKDWQRGSKRACFLDVDSLWCRPCCVAFSFIICNL